MTKIYVVEDEKNIRELILYALKSVGFEVFGFEMSKDFFESYIVEEPDLIVLDVMLPESSGLEILAKLRETSDVPVIMLSAKGTEFDRVSGLDLGADDYITKPFSVLELISRIKTVLRRSRNPEVEKVHKYGEVVLIKDKHEVTVCGEKVNLTRKEFELLELLLQNKENVITRDKILEKVWGFNFSGESRTVDMHIKSLRQKLGEEGRLITTVRGVGYKVGV